MNFKFRLLDRRHLELSVKNTFTQEIIEYEDAVQLLREFKNVVEELENFIEQTER